MVVHTLDALTFLLCFAQGWQKHAGEDRNNGDDNEQLDQGESFRGNSSGKGGVNLGRYLHDVQWATVCAVSDSQYLHMQSPCHSPQSQRPVSDENISSYPLLRKVDRFAIIKPLFRPYSNAYLLRTR